MLISPHRYRESRKLIGFATSFDPEELYQAARNPIPKHTSVIIPDYITEQARERELDITYDDKSVVNILRAGIRDINDLTETHFRRQTSHEECLEFIDSETTVRAIACLAMNNEKMLENYTKEVNRQARRAPTPQPYMVLPKAAAFPRPHEGCPAAIHEEGGPIDPLFKKFVRWSGRIALESMMHHRLICFPEGQ